MRAKNTLLLILLVSAILSLSQPARAETYQQCPDSAKIYKVKYNYITNDVSISPDGNVTSEICSNKNITLRKVESWYLVKLDILSSVWHQPSDLFKNHISIRTMSVQITLKAYTYFSEETSISFFWQCGNETPDFENLIENREIGREFTTINLDVTDYALDCDDDYQIIIAPKWNDDDFYLYKNTTITQTDLVVDYSVARLETSINAPIESQKYDSSGDLNTFYVTGNVLCTEAYCGNVEMVLQYFDGTQYRIIPTATSSSITPFITNENPHPCGGMDEDEVCEYMWSVRMTKFTRNRTYSFRVAARSSITDIPPSADKADTSIKTGILAVQSSFSPNPVFVNDKTELKSEIHCREYNCGKIRIFSKKGSSNIEENESLSVSPQNPIYIGPMVPGDDKSVMWTVTPSETGDYPDIYSLAHTNGIETYVSNTLTLHAIPRGTGTLTIEDMDISPETVYEGDTATVSATVKCTGDSYSMCGTVEAHLKEGGSDIPASGYSLTTETNPLTSSEYPCLQDMVPGSSCDIEWSLSGNSAGEYDISIEPVPDTSATAIPSASGLTVKKQPGDILLSAHLTKNIINKSSYTILSADAECSTDYCGNIINLSVKYSTGVLLTSYGDLTTEDPNPLSCSSLPCTAQWDITGNEADNYLLEVSAVSDETENSTNLALYVKNPDIPPEPTLSVPDIDDITLTAGNSFVLSVTVFCSGASCGEVTNYIQYFDNQWKNLTPTTPLNTENNTQQCFLDAGDSKTLSWNITASQTGSFLLRMVSQSPVTEVSKEFHVNAAPPGEILIEIHSPEEGSVFSRGDEVSLKIRVTENGNPKTDITATSSFSDNLFPDIQLKNTGNGYYESSFPVPHDAEGPYNITFHALNSEAGTVITIDPSLSITFSLNKYNYQIPDTIKISGTVYKKESPANSEVKINIECGNWSSGTTTMRTNESGGFEYAYHLEKTPSGTCFVMVRAEDNYGNSGTAARNITIQKSEYDIYTLTFLSPSPGEVFNAGENVSLSLKVENSSSPVTGAEVYCTDITSYSNREVLLNETSPGIYSAILSGIRKNPYKDTWSVTCTAKTSDGFFGTGFMNIIVKPTLLIDIIEPRSNETEKGETIHFIISVYYSYDGTNPSVPLDNGTISITLMNDNTTINLSYTALGKYEAAYHVKNDGRLLFRVLAEDPSGIEQSSDIEIHSVSRVRVNIAAIAMVIAGAVILLSAFLIHRTRKSKTIVKTVVKTVVKGPDRKEILRNKIKDLQKKANAIEKAKEDAEMEYYQRKLSEKEFKAMMENYEQELLRVKEEIAEFEKELHSLEQTKK